MSEMSPCLHTQASSAVHYEFCYCWFNSIRDQCSGSAGLGTFPALEARTRVCQAEELSALR